MRGTVELALQAVVSLAAFFAAGVAAAGVLPLGGARSSLAALGAMAFTGAALLVWRRREGGSVLVLAATALAWLGGVGRYALPALAVVFALASASLAAGGRPAQEPRVPAPAEAPRLPRARP